MSTGLAIDGGTPTRRSLLPYGRQTIDEYDIQAVTKVLRSDWLTTGPQVRMFEREFADCVGAREAVAVSSGTAALHAALAAVGVGPGDEVIVPAMTFVATANSVVAQGAVPVFADVDRETLHLSAETMLEKVSPRTRAVIAVDYTGQPCDYDALAPACERHGLSLVADACHSLGGTYKGRAVGTLAALNAFSLHPVKSITSGEGGVITTGEPALAVRMRAFRNHGIASDHQARAADCTWVYDMTEFGYNYRLTDVQCALARSQLSKLSRLIDRRREIAHCYDEAFLGIAEVAPLTVRPEVRHPRHLYVIRLDLERLRADRALVYRALRGEGIGVGVHYIPVHLHGFYRRRFGTRHGQCPVAEGAYETLLSLPIFPAMTAEDIDSVVSAVRKVIHAYAVLPAGSGMKGGS